MPFMPTSLSDPSLWQAIVLGLIEGLTEFIPVSSTGHLLIAEHWLGQRSDLFNVVIQAGAVLAVMLVYRQRLWYLATHLHQNTSRDYVAKLATAFLVTAVLGFVTLKLGFALPQSPEPVAWALVVGGAWMLLAEGLASRLKPRSFITWRVAVLVGLAQVVAAIWPGTSRSAATIFIALLAGTSDRPAATEFAFLVGLPTMLAASGYELVHHGLEPQAHEPWLELWVAFIVAALTGFIAVRWLLGYIRQHRYVGFACYRIALGGTLLVVLQHTTA